MITITSSLLFPIVRRTLVSERKIEFIFLLIFGISFFIQKVLDTKEYYLQRLEATTKHKLRNHNNISIIMIANN